MTKGKPVVPPSIKECTPRPCDTSSDFQVENPSSVPGRYEYNSLITEIEKVKVDCHWGKSVQVEIPSRGEDITKHKASLGEAILMRESPPGEADIPKPAKEKKRKKKSSAESLKTKKAKIQKPLADSVASTREAAESLCAEGEESDDHPVSLKISNQAFSKSQTELAHCEDKFRKLVSELDKLKALHAQKKRYLGDLRAHLERISREWADFDEHLKQKDDLMREELRVRDTKILPLKQCIDELLSYLHPSKSSCALSSYRKDVAATNTRVMKVSEEAELKLSCAFEHARLISLRQAIEDAYAREIDLSADIERTKALEEELATLLSSDDGSSSESTSGSEDDEFPEGEGIEDQYVEGTNSEGASSG
ncbi:uncharacterized protein [Nicotiana sylvestris]|uniref:uncharacterized protein n=1 Tax=Nicotiana sylvestris TaxID=4096 RepID=UPI00388C98BF